MNDNNKFVDSAENVRKALLEESGFEANEYEIRMVMRDELGMRYKKIVPI